MGIRLHYIPWAIFFFMPILFTITFIIALQLGHINAFFAYISDTGTKPPEMCIFGLGLSFSMILTYLFVYVRYKQVEEFLRLHESEGSGCCRSRTLNTVGLYSGCIASIGIGVVGAFQETNAFEVHVFGAFMAFGGGSVSFIIQGILSRRMVPHMCSEQMALIRIIIGVLCIFLYVVCQGSGVISVEQFKGKKEELLKWEPKHGAWELRIISTVTEWVMFAFFQLYFLSFVSEFKRIKYVPPHFKLMLLTASKEGGDTDSTGDDGQEQPTVAVASNQVKPEHGSTHDITKKSKVSIES